METQLKSKVEELGENDIFEIAQLFRKVWLEGAEEYPEEWRRLRALNETQILKEMREGYRFFGIRINNQLVGVYKAFISKEGLLGEHQSVHPNHRQKGLATVMYEHFIDFAEKHGCKKVYVNILLGQAASRKIVEKMSFTKVGKPFEQAKGMLVQTYEKRI